VRQAFHGKGVAQQLMQFAIDYCKHQNYNNLYLGVWQENHKALNFTVKLALKPSIRAPFNLAKGFAMIICLIWSYKLALLCVFSLPCFAFSNNSSERFIRVSILLVEVM